MSQEAAEIVSLILDMLQHGASGGRKVVPTDVAVVAAFHRQTLLIRQLLKKKSIFGVEVGGVESIQGKEKKAVFVSVVRARKTFIECIIRRISTQARALPRAVSPRHCAQRFERSVVTAFQSRARGRRPEVLSRLPL